MNQRRGFSTKQTSIAEAWRPLEARWQFSQSHRAVAQLTVVLECRPARRTLSKPSREGKAGIVPLLVGVAVLITLVIVCVGTSYLYGMLLEKLPTLQYNQAQAQYSDVWKWSSQR